MKFFLIFSLFFVTNVCSTKNWWKNREMYDVYVPSYKDFNNDGVGDFRGLKNKLPHIKDLGIEIIKLSLIQHMRRSENGGEGVINFRAINPILGTMEDFREFLSESIKNDIKVIINLPINHCHKDHHWFAASRLSVPPYKDYFVWKDSASNKEPVPPNSWKDERKSSAWKWDDLRKQFYYTRYEKDLPDFNFWNPEVRKEIKKIMEFWLNEGVAGFSLPGAPAYIEDELLRNDDNTRNSTENQPETFDLIREFRKILDNHKSENFERILMIEDNINEKFTLKYFGDDRSPLFHFISDHKFSNKIWRPITSTELNDLIMPTVTQIQLGKQMQWISDASFVQRLTNRFDKQFSDVIITIMMMLPGISSLYYGQEIGMSEHHYYSLSQPINFHALPMQWDDSLNGGFTEAEEPYAIPNPDYWTVNVKNEKQKNTSRYHMIKDLMNLRKLKAIKSGKFTSYIISKWVYGFVRTGPRNRFLVITNLTNTPEIIVDLHKIIDKLPETGYVSAASINSIHQKGAQLNLRSPLFLRPSSSMVLRLKKTN